MAVPNLLRRLEAAEGRHGVNQISALVVLTRPDGLCGANLAAWETTEERPDAAITIIIRRFVAWPPRNAAEVRRCVNARLCLSALDLAAKIRAMPPYPEQAAALMALAS